MSLEAFIAAARGDEPADLVLKNAQLVNVLSGEVHPADIAIFDGKVLGFGDYNEARQTVDLAGRYVCPGFMDAHVHLESAMVQLRQIPVADFGATLASELDRVFEG